MRGFESNGQILPPVEESGQNLPGRYRQNGPKPTHKTKIKKQKQSLEEEADLSEKQKSRAST